MKTAVNFFEDSHASLLFSFHTEIILYQKSDFRAIGGFKATFLLRVLQLSSADFYSAYSIHVRLRSVVWLTE